MSCLTAPPIGSPPPPVLDAHVLQAWLRRARPGDAFEYHRGLLAVERNPLGRPMPKAKRQALDRLANAVWALGQQGLAHLVQRRIEPGAFSYLAIARQAPGTAIPSVQHVQEPCR